MTNEEKARYEELSAKDCLIDDEDVIDYYRLRCEILEERLEQLEKIFSDSHICEIKARFNEIECSVDKCENCPLGIGDGICLKNTFEKKWELQKENKELKEQLRFEKVDFELENSDLNERLDYLEKKNQELKEQRLSLSLQLQDYKLIKEITLPNVLEENEKLTKAIEILKEKNVNIVFLMACGGLKDYNNHFRSNKLTQEEYDLLKEVLGE